MTPKREYALAMVLVVGGALLTWFAYGRSWVEGPPCTDELVPGCGAVTTGAALEPTGGAVALTMALTSLAVIPTRGRGRQAVGVLLMGLAGAGAAVAVSSRSLSSSSWWWVALLGSALGLIGGLVVAWRGPSWSTMSTRYERTSSTPAAGTGQPADQGEGPEELGAKEAWDAMERGVDPTLDPAIPTPGVPSPDEPSEPPSDRRSDPTRDPGRPAGNGLSE